jgi:multiple sugar transport system ATP-binding protein
MNFVPGRLSTEGGAPVVSFLGTSVAMDGAHLTGEVSGGDITVGIRPEDLMWRRAAGADSGVVLPAEVDVVEPMGHEAYVTAVCAGQTVIARFPPRSGVRTHERIDLALNPARLHLFDAKTGEAVVRRPVANTADAARSAREARILDSVEPDSNNQGHTGLPSVQGEDKKLRGGTA